MTEARRVPTNVAWTAESLIAALQKLDPKTPLQFGGAAAAKPGGKQCWCGCGSPTNNRFAVGHDARFHGLAGKVAQGLAERPTSFVCSEAEADFDHWVQKKLNELAAKRVAPVLAPVAVIRSIELTTVEEPSEAAENLLAELG